MLEMNEFIALISGCGLSICTASTTLLERSYI